MRSRVAGVDPAPAVDDVDDRRRRPSRRHGCAMRPPAGLNLIALSTRLISACRSTSRSAQRVAARPRRSTTIACCFSSASTPRCATTSSASAAQVDDLARQPRLPGLGARQRQQPIDQARQPIDLLEHAADDAAIRRLVAVPAQADFADAADRRQRRAQLVRHVGGEPPHLLERALEPRRASR